MPHLQQVHRSAGDSVKPRRDAPPVRVRQLTPLHNTGNTVPTSETDAIAGATAPATQGRNLCLTLPLGNARL